MLRGEKRNPVDCCLGLWLGKREEMEGGGGGWRRRIGTDCADCGEGFAGVAAYYIRHVYLVLWFVCFVFS